MQGIGICLMSMRLIDIHLVGVDPIGVYLLQGGLWIILLRNDLCAKLPRTRIRLALIRPRNAPPIHSGPFHIGVSIQVAI
jgi:hypothetical protein